MNQFERKHFMDRAGVVAIPLQMAGHDVFYPVAFEIRPALCLGIEQHLTDVIGEGVPVPDAKMIELVSAKKQSLQMQRRKEMVDLCYPLRHAVVVGILRFESKLEVLMLQTSGKRILARPGRDPTASGRVPRCLPRSGADKYPCSPGHFAKLGFRRAKCRAHEIIIEKWASHRQLGLFESQQAVMMPGSWRKTANDTGCPVATVS